VAQDVHKDFIGVCKEKKIEKTMKKDDETEQKDYWLSITFGFFDWDGFITLSTGVC